MSDADYSTEPSPTLAERLELRDLLKEAEALNLPWKPAGNLVSYLEWNAWGKGALEALRQSKSKQCTDDHTPPNKLNEVYTERNRVVAALARLLTRDRAIGLRIGVAEHDPNDENWHPDWRTLLVIDDALGVGSMTWHFPIWDRHLLDGLPVMTRYDYDGHTTVEKYRRLESYATQEGTDRNGGYNHMTTKSQFSPVLCKMCGSRHRLVSTSEARDFVVAQCPQCGAAAPYASSVEEAKANWDKLMGDGNG